ncbi:Crp/Fnr family transcriptional regulator [Nocardia sp. NRRL S-836]|uniref:Crp/Fnr family transcriptional regulator n=1 Tax=Nocardia sp. NRRL S-836 TaxID=1519492 RepID=UPI0006AEE9B4|nr:Crp/Fnr family transcriptional regulator [Nocardia sp. NRRL S-836]
MLRGLARQVRRSDTGRTDLMLTDVPSRTAKALLQLASRCGHAECRAVRVAHGLTQKEQAQYVGTSREMMNRVLAGFSRRGWVQVEAESVRILDPERLLRGIQLTHTGLWESGHVQAWPGGKSEGEGLDVNESDQPCQDEGSR